MSTSPYSDPATPVNNEPARARALFPPWLIAVILAVVTLALYWPAINYSYVNYDDLDYVLSNQHVQTGLTPANIRWALTTGHSSQLASVNLDIFNVGCQPVRKKCRGNAFHQPAPPCG